MDTRTGEVARLEQHRDRPPVAAGTLLRPSVYAWALLGATLAVVGLGVLVDEGPAAGLFPVAAVASFFLAVRLLPATHMVRGGVEVPYRYTEFATVIGLAVLPAWLVPLVWAMVELPAALWRWWRSPPRRSRLLVDVASTAVGVTAMTYLAVLFRPLSGELFAAFIAAGLAAVLTDLVLATGLRLRGGRPVRKVLRADWKPRVGPPVVTAAVGSLVVLGLRTGDLSVPAVPVLIGASWLAMRAWAGALRDRETWRRMDRVSADLIAQLDEWAILRRALPATLDLFRARRVEVTLYRSGATGGFIASMDAARTTETIPVQPLMDNQPPPAPPRLPTVFVQPLVTRGQEIGRLVVHLQSADRSHTRWQLMTTFAQLVASTLLVARMYEEQRREAEVRAYQAERDPLTGLGNRAMLQTRAPELLAGSNRHASGAALLLLDLDGFKRINDTLGHAAGDSVLTEVGRRLGEVVRHNDVAVRLGGDEFAVLASFLHDADDAGRVAEKLLAALAPVITVEGLSLTVEGSVGIAVHGRDGDTVEELLRAADAALYDAKAHGRGHWRYPRFVEDTGDRTSRALAGELSTALARDQLVLHYQPQVDVRSGEVVGFEALVRWEHPTLGLLPPSRFVAIAEQSGLIRPFTLTILDLALRDHRALRQHVPGSSMSVNMSARNLMDQALVGDIERALARHAVPAGELTVEMTETAPSDAAAIANVLAGLEQLGCRVSLDDFGTGYSSMASLRQRSAVREVKIDRGFVADLTHAGGIAPRSEGVNLMVRAIVDMAHGMGCQVVAEGVEDAGLTVVLRSLGCDVVQGFHVGRPMPLPAVVEWLSEWADARWRRLSLDPVALSVRRR